MSPCSSGFRALLLSFILPSCGHFWLRSYWWGFAIVGALLFAIGLFCWSGWVFEPQFGSYLLYSLAGIYGVNLISAFVLGWRLRKRQKLKAQLFAVMVVLAVGFVMLIKFNGILFGAQVFYIPSQSMEPTLKVGDYVVVNRTIRGTESINAGDIVVFKQPDDSAFYIKRVMAKPGDILEVTANQLIVNGQFKSSNMDDITDFVTTLGDDDYYVMGDNYQHSYDSRHWGLLNRVQIVGVYQYTIGNLAH